MSWDGDTFGGARRQGLEAEARTEVETVKQQLAEGDHSYDDYLRERARAEAAEQQLAQAREENTRWYKRMERGQKQLAEAQGKIHSLVWNKDGYCRGCGNYGLDNSHFDDCELAPIADGEEGE